VRNGASSDRAWPAIVAGPNLNPPTGVVVAVRAVGAWLWGLVLGVGMRFRRPLAPNAAEAAPAGHLRHWRAGSEAALEGYQTVTGTLPTLWGTPRSGYPPVTDGRPSTAASESTTGLGASAPMRSSSPEPTSRCTRPRNPVVTVSLPSAVHRPTRLAIDEACRDRNG